MVAPINTGSAARADTDPGRPNILVVMVDEMRAPQWFPSPAALDEALPNIARIRSRAVSFEQHYTAANMCTPARGALVTGLYPHQTGCMLTNVSTLSPGFPTWGSMLRAEGYETTWYGKWHLGNAPDTIPGGLEAYGFAGGTYPSPNGTPGQGLRADPGIATQFANWLDTKSGSAPWCTTVSFVNPHDVQWWPRWTWPVELRHSVPRVFSAPAPNLETAQQLRANKPGLQSALLGVGQLAFGPVGYRGPLAKLRWARILDLYLWLQQQVDTQIGRVLDALYAKPAVAANTIIVFTADHGEYAGSHGLRGKGGGAYDEAIRVPLYIHDPRGFYSTGSATTRTQLSSSVDLTPFLLTIATGGNSWRTDDRYAHLAHRGDIAALCNDPHAPGRPWVAHVTDEHTIEEGAILFARNAPSHVAAVRTPEAKFVAYSHWTPDTITIDPAREQEFELYDYTTERGRLELDNIANHGGEQLRQQMRTLLDQANIEINQPLPPALQEAQRQGFADFYAHNARTFALK